MAKQNINTCTARELSNLPGIDRPLAESVIQHRSTNNGFHRMDELLTLPNMTRPKFEILCRKFSLATKPLVLGFTNQHMHSGMTVAPTQFVCQGQSVNSKTDENHDFISMPRSTSLEGCPKSKNEGPQVGVPLFKGRPCGACSQDKHQLKVGRSHVSQSCEYQASQAKKNKQRMSSMCLKPPGHSDCKKGGNFSSGPPRNGMAWVGEAKPALHKRLKDSNNEPSVTLRATASGNNINFSCTIDKRLLANPVPSHSPMTKRWTLGKDNYNVAIGNVMGENHTASPQTQAEAKVSYSDEAMSSESSATLEDPLRSQKPYVETYLECSTSTNITSTKTASSSAPDVSPLTVENMLLYDHRNRMTLQERKRYVQCWLAEVHDTFFDSQLKALIRKRYSGNRKQYIRIPSGGQDNDNQAGGKMKHRLQRGPLMIGPGRIDHEESLTPSPSPDLKSRSLGQKGVTKMGARATKSATAREESLDNVRPYTEPLNILQKRAVKSGHPNVKAPQRNVSLQATGNSDQAKKIKHLINNYMAPRTKKRLSPEKKSPNK